MRTAALKGGGADANRRTAEPGFSITSAAAGQALTNVPPAWRRLDSVIAEIVAAMQRRHHADFAVAST